MRKIASMLLVMCSGMVLTGRGLEIGRVAVPPRLDGNLDEDCWQHAAAITNFMEEGNSAAAADGTWAKIAYDDACFYLAFSCPHPHSQMMKAEDDGVSYKVHYDEHVELAISPDQMSQRLFRAQINPRGIIQITEYNKSGKANWDYGDFCRAATAITTNGWNLEMSIPWLRVCAKKEFRPDTMALNLSRSLLANKVDQYGVFTGYETHKKSLSLDKPKNSMSQYASELLPVKFKDPPPTLQAPFVVAIVQADVTDYAYHDGKCQYGVAFKLEGFSRESGKVLIYVDDPLAPATRMEPVLSVKQGPAISPALSASVACQAFTPRDLKLRVTDERGGTIAERVIPSPAIFDVLNARLDRNYYTDEKVLNVVYECRLPAELAGKANLRVMVGGDNKPAAEVMGLSRHGTLKVDIAALPLGVHQARIVCEIAGQQAYEQTFDLIKRAPAKVLEVKLDHGRRCLLVNGEPFFPFGVLTHSAADEDLRVLAEHGVNTVSPWFVAKATYLSAEGYHDNMDMIVEFVKKAAKHNIFVMPNLDNLGTSAAGLPGLAQFFPADKQELIAQQAEHMTEQGMKGKFAMGDSLWRDLPRARKNQLFEELYQKTAPYYKLAVEEFRKYPNVIGYFFYDEPTLGEFDMNVQGKKLYNLIKAVDGYRPTWTLYSSYIPTGAAATDWIDCLGTDPYWVPPVTNPEGIDRWSVNFVSRITAANKQRADDANRVCWSIPMLENWSMTYKRLPTAEEFRCQSYLALIHGAKGLVYFIYPVGTAQAMASLLRVGNEVKTLTPWLLTKDIPQTPSGIAAPAQYSVRVNDQGRHVALVANSRPWPVQFTMGLPQALFAGGDVVKEFFTGEMFKVANGAFTDTLPPFAVKVYAIGESAAVLPEIKVDIKVTETKEGWRPEVVYTPDGRPGKRNILPNPSFEEASIPGVPDYYFCGRKDPYPAWGSPDSPWTLDDKAAYHGKRSLRIHVDKLLPERNFFYVGQFIAPKHRAAAKYMFSVYMKADCDDAPVIMAYGGATYATFKVGREWKRYNLVITVPPNVPFYNGWILRPTAEGVTVWVDAAQMEAGEKITDFEE